MEGEGMVVVVKQDWRSLARRRLNTSGRRNAGSRAATASVDQNLVNVQEVIFVNPVAPVKLESACKAAPRFCPGPSGGNRVVRDGA